MDSRTPSLDDGGLVLIRGPRLIGYDQLPPSQIVVMPTKVFLWNRHPLSSSSTYSNTEQDANQKSKSSRRHLTWTLNFIWQKYNRTLCHKLFLITMAIWSTLLQFIIAVRGSDWHKELGADTHCKLLFQWRQLPMRVTPQNHHKNGNFWSEPIQTYT